MFKPITSLLLIFAIAAQAFKGGIIMLDYYTNTLAFAKNCINKSKPKSHCNGKCQMMKRIQEEEKKQQQAPEKKIQNEETLSSKSFFTVTALPTIETVSGIKKTDYSHFQPIDIHIGIFHPPRIS